MKDLKRARTVGAVGGVLILILLVRMLLGRAARLGAGGIRGQLCAGGRAPSGIVQILGRYPVSRGQMLVLMKLDRRVLLLSQTSAGFATPIQITDSDDLASIPSKSPYDARESPSAPSRPLPRIPTHKTRHERAEKPSHRLKHARNAGPDRGDVVARPAGVAANVVGRLAVHQDPHLGDDRAEMTRKEKNSQALFIAMPRPPSPEIAPSYAL